MDLVVASLIGAAVLRADAAESGNHLLASFALLCYLFAACE
jgi:hypothetical protein